jgi:hypothetical protein
VKSASGLSFIMDIFLYIQSKANGDIGTVNGNGNGNNYGNTTKST